jgi:hypothetical protein
VRLSKAGKVQAEQKLSSRDVWVTANSQKTNNLKVHEEGWT